MNHEFQTLLRACCELRGLRPRGVGSDTTPLDEAKLVDYAVRHKVSRLFYRWVKKNPGSLSPDGEKRLRLQALSRHNFQQALVHEWLDLVDAFSAQGFPVLTVKGPALSCQLYSDPLEREYWDIDLLVPVEDPLVLVAFMETKGYGLCDAEKTLDAKTLAQWFRFSHHIGFLKKEGGFHVEIHHHLWKMEEELFEARVEDLFRRRVELVWQGRRFFTLSPVDHAVFLLSHSTSHAWCLLSWLFDGVAIPSLLSQLEDGEREFLDRAPLLQRALGQHLIEGFVEIALVWTPTPPPQVLPSLLRFCRSRLLCAGADMGTMRVIWQFRLAFMAHFFRRPWKAWLVFLCAPNVGDFAMLPLPEAWHFLYVLLRPLFVVVRRFRRVLGAF